MIGRNKNRIIAGAVVAGAVAVTYSAAAFSGNLGAWESLETGYKFLIGLTVSTVGGGIGVGLETLRQKYSRTKDFLATQKLAQQIEQEAEIEHLSIPSFASTDAKLKNLPTGFDMEKHACLCTIVINRYATAVASSKNGAQDSSLNPLREYATQLQNDWHAANPGQDNETYLDRLQTAGYKSAQLPVEIVKEEKLIKIASDNYEISQQDGRELSGTTYNRAELLSEDTNLLTAPTYQYSTLAH